MLTFNPDCLVCYLYGCERTNSVMLLSACDYYSTVHCIATTVVTVQFIVTFLLQRSIVCLFLLRQYQTVNWQVPMYLRLQLSNVNNYLVTGTVS